MFVVKDDGSVGIGTADTKAQLQIKTQLWNDGSSDIGAPMLLFEDPADNILGGFFNVGGGTNANDVGGAFGIATQTNSGLLSFGVFNTLSEKMPFGVLDNGTVGIGIDMNTFTPQAQVNIGQSNNYNYLLKLQNDDQSVDYFDVHNNGYVGIGGENNGTATLAIVSHDDNIGNIAALSVVGASTTPRFLYAGNSPTPSSSTNTYFSVKSTGTGVGTDDLSHGSTLAIKAASSSDTKLDLMENSTTVTGNAQLRWLGSTGTVRHKITETSTGELLIDAGVASSGATNRLKVDGDVVSTGDVSAANNVSAQNNVEAGVNIHAQGSGHIEGDFWVEGNMKIGTHTITSGTHNNAKLYVEGKIAAKYVVVTESNWADYVFNSNYKLRSIPDLENYIKANHHLPEVPDECDVQEQGVNVGEMNATLLKKIEELTLYAIVQQKQLDKLKEQLNALINW